MAMIVCENISFAYEGKSVIEGLDFEVERGDYLCVVGENGSGKSTLIKGLLRLKAPSSGRIIFEQGLEARDVGYLPQQSDSHRDFPASVGEVVLSGRLGGRGAKPFYSKEDRRLADESMERLGLLPLRNRCYRELSGGWQQRAMLARALCGACKLLLLDEPVAGLDPLVTTGFYELVELLNRENGLTVIMVSHDIRGAVKRAGHILHLKNSGAFFGTATAYLRSEVGRAFAGGEYHA